MLSEQLKTMIKEATLAYRFSPSAYTYETMNQCFAVRATIERVLGPLEGLHDPGESP